MEVSLLSVFFGLDGKIVHRWMQMLGKYHVEAI